MNRTSNPAQASDGQKGGKGTGTDLFFSLADQGMVSGGNFLTIALGAACLPIGEQGKLVYIYSAYIALVLFNVAAYFSVANIVRHEAASPKGYRQILLAAHAAGAVPAALLLLLGLLLFHEPLKWQATPTEAALLMAFLVVQQLADFDRRQGYVFGRIRHSALQSLWLYGTRIAAILYFQPEAVTGFLLAMLLPGMPLALAGLSQAVRQPGYRGLWQENRELVRSHLRLCRSNIYGVPLRWGGLHLPILLVGALHSVEAAAILGTLRAITTFANVLLELLETFVPAWLSEKGRRGKDALRSGSRMLLGIGALVWLAGAIAIYLFGERAVLHLLGADQVGYAPILNIVWAGNGIYFAGRIVAMHYRMMKDTWLEFLGLASGVGALLLSIPLIPNYGAWGGAWCLTIVQFATLAASLAYGVLPRSHRRGGP